MIYNLLNKDSKYYNLHAYENNHKALELFLNSQEKEHFEVLEFNEKSIVKFQRKSTSNSQVINHYHVQPLERIYKYDSDASSKSKEAFIENYKTQMATLDYVFIGKTRHNYVFKKQTFSNNSYYKNPIAIEEVVGNFDKTYLKIMHKNINFTILTYTLLMTTILVLLGASLNHFKPWNYIDRISYNQQSMILSTIMAVSFILIYPFYMIYLLNEKRNIKKRPYDYLKLTSAKSANHLITKHFNELFVAILLIVPFLPLIKYYFIHIMIMTLYIIFITFLIVKINRKYLLKNNTKSNIIKILSFLGICCFSILLFSNVSTMIIEPYDVFISDVQDKYGIKEMYFKTNVPSEDIEKDSTYFTDVNHPSILCPLYYRAYLFTDKEHLSADLPYYELYDEDHFSIKKETYYFLNSQMADINIDYYLSNRDDEYRFFVKCLNDDSSITKETYYFYGQNIADENIYDYFVNVPNNEQLLITQNEAKSRSEYNDKITIIEKSNNIIQVINIH